MRYLIVLVVFLSACSYEPHPWEDLNVFDESCRAALIKEAAKGSRAIPETCETYEVARTKKGRYNEALRGLLNQILKLEEAGEYEKAITIYDKAIALHDDIPEVYYGRGNAKSELGRPEDAIADYDKAIALNPNFTDAYFNRGYDKDTLGRYEDAIADYDKAIALNPEDHTAYYERGESKSKLGRYRAAIADFNRALEIKRNFGKAVSARTKARRKLAEGGHKVNGRGFSFAASD